MDFFCKCRCSTITFFLSVSIMDRYLKNGPKMQSSQDLHLIALGSMLISSKMQDNLSTRLKLTKIIKAYSNISAKKLCIIERNIAIILKFEFKATFSWNFLRYLCEILKPKALVERTAQIILVMNRFDYKNNYYPFDEAATALFIAARSLNEIELMNEVTKIVASFHEDIEFSVISMQTMLSIMKLNTPNFSSPMHYMKFEMDRIENSSLFIFY